MVDQTRLSGMGCPVSDQAPAMLQLQKWGPPQLQFNLSEFQEAFISPTRQLLLLLSYNREALVVPLHTGNKCSEYFNTGNFLDPCSLSYDGHNASNIKNNFPSTSVLLGAHYSKELLGCKFPENCSYPSISDVNSVAWGAFGDTYGHQLVTPFKEFLFVSGCHGVIVHAFCWRDDTINTVENVGDSHLAEGRWTEWGPSVLSAASTEVCSNYSCSENADGFRQSDGLSGGIESKKWLQSYFTEVKTVKESDGSFWVRLPARPSYPSTAKVVSFSLFGDTLRSADHNILSKHMKNDCANQQGIDLDQGDHDSSVRSLCSNFKSGFISTFLGARNMSAYHCSKVFSCRLHQLVGFALQFADYSSEDSNNVSKSDRKINFVVVGRLSTLGLQWVSHVDLEDTPVSPAGAWTDFCFSESVLVCLTSSGRMCFYFTMSGQCMGHLDIFQACGLNVQLKTQQQKSTNLGVCIETEHADEDANKLASESGHHFTKTKFRRLVAASYTSLLGAIDETGITYVIDAAEYLSDTCYPRSNLLPNTHNFGCLVGCAVDGYDISHPMICTCLPKLPHTDRVLSGISPLVGDTGTLKYENFQKCYTDGKPSDISIQSKHRRSIFLPSDGFTKNDCICLSPLGITRLVRNNRNEKHCSQVRHHHLWVDSVFHDDKCLNSRTDMDLVGEREDHPVEITVGCSFQGCLYVLTLHGLAVALPSLSGLSGCLADQVQLLKGERPMGVGEHVDVGRTLLHSPWKVHVLDQAILYDGLEVVDRLCGENGWDLQYPRMRQLQLALMYLKFDEIHRSLEMLLSVNLFEEGILKLLFHAALLVSRKVSIDNDVAAALRLLAVASSFATKILRICGSLQQNVEAYKLIGCCDQAYTLSSFIGRMQNEAEKLTTLKDIAYLLEVIRNMQRRLGGMANDKEALILVKSNLEPDESGLSIVPVDLKSHWTFDDHGNSLSVLSQRIGDGKIFALAPVEFYLSVSNGEHVGESTAIVPLGAERLIPRRNIIPVETPMEMMTRWKTDNLDLKTVVKDALFSGRLPLAVLQLHLHRLGDLVGEKEKNDYFIEVRDIGRAIAYDLLLKGEMGLALETLQRLGEDIRTSLKQVLLGSLRRSLRIQIAEVMESCGYLGSNEHCLLSRVDLIERLYPRSCFWKNFHDKQEEFGKATSNSDASREKDSQLLLSTLFTEVTFECGEVDGVVLGPWVNLSSNSTDYSVNEESTLTGYWAAAAVWSSNWDQKTIDRVVLDQPFLMGVHLLWDSQLEYHISHNDWEEVAKLLDLLPPSSLSDGRLRIAFDDPQSAPAVVYNTEISISEDYSHAAKDIGVTCMDVPNVKIFRPPVDMMSSLWLRMLLETEMAKKFIFLREFWGNTYTIVSLLAHSGFITRKHDISADGNVFDAKGDCIANTVLGLHKVFVRHCIPFCLPNLLDLYLDHHMPDLYGESLGSLLEAVGDCQWARWLLFSRAEGFEYDASFANCRSIITRGLPPCNNLDVQMINETMRTVDEIAEGGGELAALATLMYAHVPIQNCLSIGSVKRQSSSAQCTLENLQPILQHFTTLRRALVAACFGREPPYSVSGNKAKSVYGISSLANYLVWREHIFFSADRDTSLIQMLPCWFPKAVRSLVQLYVQGPLGWQSLTGPEYTLRPDVQLLLSSNEFSHISPISWEATIQKRIEEKLYGSSMKEAGPGFEQYLNRGRSLAAFNHLLSVRVQKFKSEGYSGALEQGQGNIQSDVQTLLTPISESEEDLISYVVPVAIMHFDDPVLVSACAFFLELCGLSAGMLRVDIAALRRIASYYSHEHDENYKLSPKGSVVHAIPTSREITGSLSRALADEYLYKERPGIGKQKKTIELQFSGSSSQALMLFLQHLEKASLPHLSDGKTCGTWLYKGVGDGPELRMQQKAASQFWNLVTAFCQMHQLALSTKYLELLAKDNDWVGFLSEAQLRGYPLDTVIQASKEFSDPRLKLHILTVMKCVLLRKKTGSSSEADSSGKANETFDYDMYNPAELFGILANCEKQQRPGESLLIKAKELLWSILAIIASCFQDVSPLTCLRVWLEITAARETSSIKVNNMASQIASNVAAAVKACNSHRAGGTTSIFHYNRKNPKRRRLLEPAFVDNSVPLGVALNVPSEQTNLIHPVTEDKKAEISTPDSSSDFDKGTVSLSKMVAVLCEQELFFPLLRAFELFLPSCSLLPFFRALQMNPIQMCIAVNVLCKYISVIFKINRCIESFSGATVAEAFSQMRLPEASAHLGSFSIRIKEDLITSQTMMGKHEHIESSWITTTAVTAADAVLSTCPSPYERRCLLQLLADTDFGDGGCSASNYRRLHWKIDFAEPSLRKDQNLHFGNETLDDASLLRALENNGNWEQARDWARQLEASGGPWKSSVHHVTEVQAESMVAEWKQFLWDVPEERVALWGHCQSLFIRHPFPPLQAGSFFLKHAENLENDLPAKELLELLLLSLQWFSGMMTHTHPVCQLHLLREIETRVWLLAVESEAQQKTEGESNIFSNIHETQVSSGIVDRTARIIAKMDYHINSLRTRKTGKHDLKDSVFVNLKNQGHDTSISTFSAANAKTKRRAKGSSLSKKPIMETVDKTTDFDDGGLSYSNSRDDLLSVDENERIDFPISKWEDRVGQAEVEIAVLLLLEFGQITAAKQLQQKLSPDHVPAEFLLVDAALKLAAVSCPPSKISVSMLDDKVCSVLQSFGAIADERVIEPIQVLESLITLFSEGSGRGLCKRIVAVVKAAKVLGISFSEAFEKQPIEVLQLLSLKAQESFEEAKLLVQTHSMPAASIAQILAESFLKGLLAAHRGGYMDSQKEEGPAPLLWRFSDFMKWAGLCPSEPEIGHALMRLVITGQEIPHACEVELLILSHHFYKSSACLDGVDVLVSLAATRVDSYVSEGDFSCLARLITGVGNFHALNFILGILIENGELDLLLQKFSAAANAHAGSAEAVRGFRMAVLTSLKQFNPNDLDAFAMVYSHFDMKHETASLLELRAEQASNIWLNRYDKDHNGDLLDSMRYYIEAAEVHSSIDAGNKTHRACAQASLVSLQIRMPDYQWLNRSETNARRVLVEQSRFQEALIVAEAYNLNQPSEWALVLWNLMLHPELTEFVAEFVSVLPLQPSMLIELARFYRAEMAARGDQSQFSVWLTGGGLPAEWAKYLARSFRCLLKRTRDLRLRLQLASTATGFGDVIDICTKALDKVPENAGLLVLRRGHGGAYLPLM